jgi:Protein involved in formate dehydrogenase formation
VRRGPRGGPGEFGPRLARARQLMDQAGGAARTPLRVLVAVLGHQQDRAATGPTARPRPGTDRLPLLDLEAAAPAIAGEVGRAVDALSPSVPEPLQEAGSDLRALGLSSLAAVVETWIDDVTLVDPRLGFWLGVAAGPVIEPGARDVAVPAEWKGSACPVCGGLPQASVIAEESGEFMAGSPRSLVCGRCASWWPFPRATCVGCGEEDPRSMESFIGEERRWARVDTCATCHGYIKTFDLRERGAIEVVPLVDDLGTLTLDVWVQQRGFSRPTSSLAGV